VQHNVGGVATRHQYIREVVGGCAHGSCNLLGLRPRPQFLGGVGGFAANTTQKNSRGGEAAPNPTAGGGRSISPEAVPRLMQSPGAAPQTPISGSFWRLRRQNEPEKLLGAASPPRTPPPEADFATALEAVLSTTPLYVTGVV
jgi:hypothetical protein